jgi:putative ABC transport system substrate-binding protein
VSSLAVLALLAALLVPLTAAAAPARVGFLWLGSVPGPTDPYFTAFREGLRAHGHVEGTTVTFEHRAAGGRPDAVRQNAADLARLNVQAIVAPGTTRARAAQEATATVPIVMIAIGDALATGVIGSLARPGGNVTGVTAASSETAAKRVELLKQAFPATGRIAVLLNGGDLSKPFDLRETETAAQALGIRVLEIDVRHADGLEAGFATMAQARADALIVLPDSFTLGHRERIVELAARQRIPAMYAFREFVMAGGLMAYGPSLTDLWARAASHVDKVLRGAKPGELPVEQPSKFELLVNRRTARAPGWTIPKAILMRADTVID